MCEKCECLCVRSICLCAQDYYLCVKSVWFCSFNSSLCVRLTHACVIFSCLCVRLSQPCVDFSYSCSAVLCFLALRLTPQIWLVAECGRESFQAVTKLKRAIDRPKRDKPRHKLYLLLPPVRSCFSIFRLSESIQIGK